jgi:hypothetical protein
LKKEFLIFLISFCSIAHAAGKDSITVYIFLLDECRICQESAPELNVLYATYGREIGFLGLFPNFSSKKKGIDTFKNKYDIRFNTKTDYFKTLAHKFDATILPEVVVYNETSQKIIYRGAINDLYYSPGKRRQISNNNYLRDALMAIQLDKKPTINQTQPIGCFINFNEPLTHLSNE